MALDYTVKYQKQIAERFKKGSITNAGAGHEYDFTGARSIKIYSMDTVALSNYGRGSTRFGTVNDATYGTQEMICSQAKSFTRHFEKLDNADIAIDATAGKFLKMEIDEVINPALDKYRFQKWTEGAATLIADNTTITKGTIVADIMALKGDMSDNLVPDANLTLYISNSNYILLKQADAVVELSGQNNYAAGAVEKGVVGMFDGMKVVPVPSSWMPSGVAFIIKSKGATVDPVKLAQYDVIEKAVGYDGPVAQGLIYYDSFVLGTKAVGVGVRGTTSAVLTPVLTNTAHVITVTAIAGATFKYTLDGTDPRYSTTATAFPAGGVTLTSGQSILVAAFKDGCASKVTKENY